MLILSGCMSTCINLLEGSHTLHCPHQYEFRMGTAWIDSDQKRKKDGPPGLQKR